MENQRIAHLEIHLAEPGSGEWLFDRLGGNDNDPDGILCQFKGQGTFDIFYLSIYFNISHKYEPVGDFEILDDGLLIEGRMDKARFGEFTEEAFHLMVEELDGHLDPGHELAEVRFWQIGENGEHVNEYVQNTFDF